jgi:hypothetical protein
MLAKCADIFHEQVTMIDKHEHVQMQRWQLLYQGL